MTRAIAARAFRAHVPAHRLLMFDIGFSEIVVIAVVALIVIGPERLPKAARTLGHLFGRLQRYVNDVKADINREMELDELRKLQKRGADRRVATSSRRWRARRAAWNRRARRRARAQRRRAGSPARRRRSRALTEPAPLPNEPGGELADAAPAEPPRQPSLPGFDKI